MKVFKCRICKEGYLGDMAPTHCPFCGAHQQYIVDAAGFYIPDYSLTEISQHNLQKSLELERYNAEFYFCASDRADNVHDATMFKRLAKIESEHADVITKELEIPSIEIRRDLDICSIQNIYNLEKSYTLETLAINHYYEYLSMATEERIIEVFTALVEIENDHLSLTNGRL